MDQKRIIGEIAARHGVRLDNDDPAFILVTITELALQDAQRDVCLAIDQRLTKLEGYLDQLSQVAASFGTASQGLSRPDLQNAERRRLYSTSRAIAVRRAGWFAIGFATALAIPHLSRAVMEAIRTGFACLS